MSEFETFLEKQGTIWVPSANPPELGTVPLDPGRIGPAELSEWLGKCAAWLSYAQSQLGLAEAQKALLQRRFSGLANSLIVAKQVKQRTYELQVAEVAKDREDLVRLQDELAALEARAALWSRMSRAYEVYVKLYQAEADKRKWSKES